MSRSTMSDIFGREEQMIRIRRFPLVLLIISAAGCSGAAAKNRANGQAALDKKDWDLAVSCFTEAIRLDPNSAEAYWKRGRAYVAQGNNDKAIADCTESL